MVRNMWVTNGALVAGMILASGLLDTSSSVILVAGLTFSSYLLYGSLFMFVVNVMYGLFLLRKGFLLPSNQVLLSGTICSFIGILVSWLVPGLF